MSSPKILDTVSIHGDEYYTLRKDAEAIADQLIEKPMNIWLPFNDANSVWKDVLENRGHKCFITDGDFFQTDPPNGVTAIVDNPPFSLKKKIVQRTTELGLDYALLLPFLWLNDSVPFDYGNQFIMFRKRVFFDTPSGVKKKPRTNCFVLSNGILKREFTIIR